MNRPELNSPDWMLAGTDPHHDVYQFALVTADTYSQSSFLDHRISPRPTELMTADANEVDSVLANKPVVPAAFVYHTAFCCSTLLATCLDMHPQTLVLREPRVLSQLAGFDRDHPAESVAPTAESLREHIDRVFGLLGRSYAGEPVIVKPSNFANRLIEHQIGWAQARMSQSGIVLISCSLTNLLVSMLKKQQEASQILSGFLTALLKDSDYLERASFPADFDIQSLDLLQQSVVFWHCQRYQFQRIVRQNPSDRILCLTMERFLVEPLETLGNVDRHLQLGLGKQQLEAVVSRGAFRNHSKQGTDYDTAERDQEARLVTQRFSNEIANVLRWADPLLRQLPIESLVMGEDPLNEGFVA